MAQSTQSSSPYKEKREATREKVEYNIRFTFTSLELGTPVRMEAEGKIIDISDKGFGLITKYPLQKGHVITIIHNSHNADLPKYGLVKWIQKEDDHYRIGLGFRYTD